MMLRVVTVCLLLAVMSTGCISRKKYNEQVSKYNTLKADYDTTESNLQRCLSEKDQKLQDLQKLEKEMAELKANSTTMLKQLSDMSVINSTQAESIRRSLENINSKDVYIKDLQMAMARKDSLNLALVMNLKGALKDVNDEDIN
ncbi:MAG: hypothetical protein JNL88_08295, partial [Bacteroidia bacterium]|nr:hypothetical protein [Bacteroidia bacterium]